MKKEEVIEKFCILASTVNQECFKHSVPSDCFCSTNSLSETVFMFDPKIIEFIQDAVNEKLDQMKTSNNGIDLEQARKDCAYEIVKLILSNSTKNNPNPVFWEPIIWEPVIWELAKAYQGLEYIIDNGPEFDKK